MKNMLVAHALIFTPSCQLKGKVIFLGRVFDTTRDEKGSTELKVDKFDPPGTIKNTVTLYPYEKLDKLIESLSPRKG